MKTIKYLVPAILIATATLLDTSESQAGLLITISDAEVAPGESGYVDVLVSSNADALNPDSFDSFLLFFSVNVVDHPVAPINFLESIGTAPQLSATSPDYIFLGHSGLFFETISDSPGPPVANDFIDVIDATDDFSVSSISSGDSPFLLARLNFVSDPMATVGNFYEVSLDDAFFDGGNLPDFAVNSDARIYMVAAAVPEPSSLLIFTIAALAWTGHTRMRRSVKDKPRCVDNH
ncbi:hypothetical protein [Roseimaritima multifibrata]|uniref:hypothetical protein n=1 Tax=Roseimaritima multifibrata TaxID=1930274 RepID=UPI0011AA5996|nr:hypothetical protein [Roseimaritima multifibrata]